VHHPLDNLQPTLGAAAISTHLLLRFIELPWVLFRRRVGKLDLGDLEEVVVIARRVCSDQKAMSGIVLFGVPVLA
jgi:hypothetical protein